MTLSCSRYCNLFKKAGPPAWENRTQSCRINLQGQDKRNLGREGIHTNYNRFTLENKEFCHIKSNSERKPKGTRNKSFFSNSSSMLNNFYFILYSLLTVKNRKLY